MAIAGEGEETSSSPKNRVKFLCSHGGKILPRPPDGQLKYVGGETRVFAVPRDINFSGLMKKLLTLSNGDNIVLKYQLIPEDLETLISVTCDEDLHHMLAEFDRHEEKSPENGGPPKLRAFLFPSNPAIILENQTAPNNNIIMDNNHVLQQTYIEAINGVVRTPPPIKIKRPSSSNNNHPTIYLSSAGSSPKSIPPDAHTIDCVNQDGYRGGNCCVKGGIPRVSSSPSLYNLSHNNNQNHQQPQPYYHQSSRPHGRLAPTISMGRSDIGRYHVGQNYSQSRPNIGSGGCIGCMQCSRVYRSGGGLEIVDSLPQSVMKLTWE